MGWLRRQFELSRGGSADNVRPMEGLRGFAVFLVFLVHYVSVWDAWLPKSGALAFGADSLHTAGQAGVDLFFVLSGYLIYGSLLSRVQRFWPFMLRRVQRIYPTFLVMFAVYLVLSFLMPSMTRMPDMEHGRVTYLIENLLLLPGLFVQTTPLLSVAWSLSYELFYYFAIPLLISVFSLRQRSVRTRVVFFVSLSCALVLDGLIFKGPLRLMMFLCGVLLFETIEAKVALPKQSSALGLVFLILGLLGLLVPIAGAAPYVAKISWLYVCFFVLCLVCFQSPKGWLGQAFSLTFLRWLGNMSYSYYLVHSLALRGIFLVLSHLLNLGTHTAFLFWALMPVVLLCSLIPAAALFVVVERPLSLKTKRHTPAPPAPALSAN